MSDMTEAPRLYSEPQPSDTLALLAGVSVRLSVEVGATMMPLAELAALEAGSVIALDRQVHEPLDICANGTRIARGEIVAVDGRYGIRITELVAGEQRLAGQEARA
jgi:flagellar motor switch protein FliN/FliY